MSIALQATRNIVSISVNDVNASMKFYVDGLGFELGQKFEHEGVFVGGMVKAGNAEFGISQDDFKKGRDRIKGVGLSFFIETPQDIDALAKRATDAGLTIEGPMNLPWGPRAFRAADPDGFAVTICSPE